MSPELMMWFMLATKMAVTALFVTAATIIAERLGAMVGALVATLPVSAGPVYVFLALDHDSTFISSSAVVSRTEQRYRDLSHGLCSHRPTTLDVAQLFPCICNVAGGRFNAQPRPMDRRVGICSQPHRIHRLYRHRSAILPRTHPTNHTTLVRLRLTSGFGGFASRRDRNSKLSNWSDGKRRACCVPGHLHEHHAHSASPRWRSCHGSRVGERRSRSCRIWRGAAHLASCRSAAWIPRGPHHRPRRFRRLERPCLCNTSPPSSCLIALPAGPFE
jgi:hypothetical protein